MLRFGVVGLSGVIVNQGLLMLLHGTIGAPLLLSSLIAIEVSILTNFLLNHTWTWRVPLGEPGLLRRVSSTTLRPSWQRSQATSSS